VLAAGLGIVPMDDAPPPSADAPTESDDGEAAAGEACSVACLPEAPAPSSSSCGDGSADLDEECDDGNTDSYDGCSAGCEIEDGYDPFVTARALSTTR
jgi:cysteine-rich repeat protein